MEIYVVLQSSGEYEDERTSVSSVWDREELAEAEAKRIIDKYEKLEAIPPPYSEEDYIQGGLTERKEKKYESWQKEFMEAREFNGAWVEAYELNTPDNK